MGICGSRPSSVEAVIQTKNDYERVRDGSDREVAGGRPCQTHSQHIAAPQVIRASKELEHILDSRFGAGGKGLHEKADSVQGHLSPVRRREAAAAAVGVKVPPCALFAWLTGTFLRLQDIRRSIHYLATIRNKVGGAPFPAGQPELPQSAPPTRRPLAPSDAARPRVRLQLDTCERRSCSIACLSDVGRGGRKIYCDSLPLSPQDRPAFVKKFVASEAQLRVILSKQGGKKSSASGDICRMQ